MIFESKRGEDMNIDSETLVRDSRRVVRTLERRADADLAPAGLTAAQGHVLLYILQHTAAGTSLTAMHQVFGISMPTLCGILKALRKGGYVRTQPCPGDERRKLLFATDKALELQSFLERTLQRGRRQLYDGFSDAELCQLAALQQKMLSNLDVSETKE